MGKRQRVAFGLLAVSLVSCNVLWWTGESREVDFGSVKIERVSNANQDSTYIGFYLQDKENFSGISCRIQGPKDQVYENKPGLECDHIFSPRVERGG